MYTAIENLGRECGVLSLLGMKQEYDEGFGLNEHDCMVTMDGVERLGLSLRRETLAQARSRGNLDVLSATSRLCERFWGSKRQECSLRREWLA
ncbi:hypothetical protein DEO72_LG8g2315 [Vigna unguiculata]|uniref:Uncharacterized protein n=1 Tax=Vigna unguiculata TaxID=3917 RepID=A0A4D6MRZ7_VIGUN|nr:hypothetical protein DEO72_LG8g2315 [Vigna unguiculata]